MKHNEFSSSFNVSMCISYVLLVIFTMLSGCTSKPSDVKDNEIRADKILLVTDAFLNSGQIKRALHYLDSSYTQFKSAGPIDKWKRYRFLKNYYLNYVIRPDKAELYTDSMFSVLKGVKKEAKAEFAESMFARADVLRAKNKYNEAFRHYLLGREFAIKNLDKCNLSPFTNRLGLIRYLQQDYLNAIGYFRAALIENNSCGTFASFETRFILPQSIYNNIALSYEKAARPDSAIYYYTKGLQFIQSKIDVYPDRKNYIESALGVFYGNLGGQLGAIGQYEKAEENLKKSIALNDRDGHAKEDAFTAKIKLCEIYIRTGRLPEAETFIHILETYITKSEGTNLYTHKIRLNMLALKARYFENKKDFQHAFVYLSEIDRLKDSVSKADRLMRGSDVDAGFREAAQSMKLDLVKKNDQLKTLFLLASIITSFMIVSILVIVWFNLKRSRKNVKELSLLNKQINKQNEQFSQTLRVLQQSQDENERLFRIVAHDLRNPIGAVHMIASLLLKKSDLYTRKDIHLFEMVKRSSSEALDLVSSLLRKKEDEHDFKKQQEDLYQILHFCIEQLNLKAVEKHLRIELNGRQVLAEVNAEQIWRVASNLIGNAIKFSKPGSNIIVKLDKQAQKKLISVEDSGIGIPDELQDKIFNGTEEVRRRGTNGEETYGLGLGISKQIVEAHGGRIWFISRSGTGTTFYVELP